MGGKVFCLNTLLLQHLVQDIKETKRKPRKRHTMLFLKFWVPGQSLLLSFSFRVSCSFYTYVQFLAYFIGGTGRNASVPFFWSQKTSFLNRNDCSLSWVILLLPPRGMGRIFPAQNKIYYRYISILNKPRCPSPRACDAWFAHCFLVEEQRRNIRKSSFRG